MTQKHFIAAAKMVKEKDWPHSQKTLFAETLADFCEQQNDRFDRARFLSACGV
jgi:hypothetical protein